MYDYCQSQQRLAAGNKHIAIKSHLSLEINHIKKLFGKILNCKLNSGTNRPPDLVSCWSLVLDFFFYFFQFHGSQAQAHTRCTFFNSSNQIHAITTSNNKQTWQAHWYLNIYGIAPFCWRTRKIERKKRCQF